MGCKTRATCIKFQLKNFKPKDHLGGTGVDRRIILNWIIKEGVKLCTKFHCLRVNLMMCFYKNGNECSVSIKGYKTFFYQFSDSQLIKQKCLHISHHIL